jgi:uncharacterized membrane protein YoaK (UPF0700 family)
MLLHSIAGTFLTLAFPIVCIFVYVIFKSNYDRGIVKKDLSNRKGCMRLLWLIFGVIFALALLTFFGWYLLNGPTRSYEYTPYMRP